MNRAVFEEMPQNVMSAWIVLKQTVYNRLCAKTLKFNDRVNDIYFSSVLTYQRNLCYECVYQINCYDRSEPLPESERSRWLSRQLTDHK